MGIVENEYSGNIAWPIVKVEYGNTRPDPIDISEAKKDISSSLTKSIGKGLNINYYKAELVPRKYEIKIVSYVS